MDKGEITMIENLKKNTGRTLEEWISIVRSAHLEKHGQIVSFLKEKHSFTHGFANLVALKSKSADAGTQMGAEQLVEAQYKGKEHFRSMYDKLITEIQSFGKDIEIAPKKTYVSVRRKKQFALLQPVSKTRFEIGIMLKKQEAKGKLEAITAAKSMCSHKINLSGLADIDKEVISWLKAAYENAG